MRTVSLTPVYNTPTELVPLGELRRFDVNGVSHFDPTTEPHAEVVCLLCDRIEDVAFANIPALPTVPGFQVVGQTQTFYGYCADCQQSHRNLA